MRRPSPRKQVAKNLNDHPEAIRRLEDRERYGVHRMELLDALGSYQAELNSVQVWAEAFTVSAFAEHPKMRRGDVERWMQQQGVITDFQRRWQVAVIPNVWYNRGAPTVELWVCDDFYPMHPRELAPEHIERYRNAVEDDPGRFVVVDLHVATMENLDCLAHLMKTESGDRRRYGFSLKQDKRITDSAIVAAQPDDIERARALVNKHYPELGRAAGYLPGKGIDPERAEPRADDVDLEDEERFMNLARRIQRRWSKLAPVVTPKGRPGLTFIR